MQLQDEKTYIAKDGRKVKVYLQKFDWRGTPLDDSKPRLFTAWLSDEEHARHFDERGKQVWAKAIDQVELVKQAD